MPVGIIGMLAHRSDEGFNGRSDFARVVEGGTEFRVRSNKRGSELDGLPEVCECRRLVAPFFKNRGHRRLKFAAARVPFDRLFRPAPRRHPRPSLTSTSRRRPWDCTCVGSSSTGAEQGGIGGRRLFRAETAVAQHVLKEMRIGAFLGVGLQQWNRVDKILPLLHEYLGHAVSKHDLVLVPRIGEAGGEELLLTGFRQTPDVAQGTEGFAMRRQSAASFALPGFMAR